MKNNSAIKKYFRSAAELQNNDDQTNTNLDSPYSDLSVENNISRRSFLNIMGASMALAGLAGCRRPVEKIIPYVVAPEELVPGIPEFYATSLQQGMNAIGLVAENHEGRPTKLEGNKAHPASLGKTDAFIQSEILNLYDPDRSKLVKNNQKDSTWNQFSEFWTPLHSQYEKSSGNGLAILSESFAGPTLVRLKKEFQQRFPNAKWYTFDPVSDENIYRGIEIATGVAGAPDYDFSKAKIILSLDSDFLQLESNNVKNSMGFADGRRVEDPNDSMNRLYCVESSMTITGGMADHRLRLQSQQIKAFAANLALQLKDLNQPIRNLPSLNQYAPDKFDIGWLKAVAKDLLENKGSSIIIAGRRQPKEVHALVHALNHALGNIGKTINVFSIDKTLISDHPSLKTLAHAVNNGRVQTLCIIGGNPVYNTPADIYFEKLIPKVQNTIRISSHFDETSALCNWHIPRSHFLEAWNDTRTISGTRAVVQPQIQPIFSSKSEIEFLNLINTGDSLDGYFLVQQTWNRILKNAGFDKRWRRVLHDGYYSIKNGKSINTNILYSSVNSVLGMKFLSSDPSAKNEIELVFRASNSVYAGEYSNVSWLQELPDPVTKICWDNAALVSQKTAQRLKVQNEDLIEISYNGNAVKLPVLIMPGQADNSVALELGFGRTLAGKVGNDVGQNVYNIQTISDLDFCLGASITALNTTYPLAITQDHHGLDLEKLAAEGIQKRLPSLIRETTLVEFQENPDFTDELVEHPPLKSMWKEHKYDESPQWGMSIDLNVCTGCNACTVACQSENNIPVVGKAEVEKGREMHWIRLDRYYTGDMDNPEMLYQPVGCQHCELAPCEQVCPVAATTHTEDGLNGMTYNRCIGTRYCANNCPYKVRRFNFFNYTKDTPEIVQMANNPDVSVRFRGVMEKCTYCVQRINNAKITTKNENRAMTDNDTISACQQVCPTDAIVFGDILDPNSRVSKLKQQHQDYALLEELNTKPRTSYLAKLRNPNPALE